MKKAYLITAVVLIAAVATSLVIANTANEGDKYSITISPSTLFLGSKSVVVTVHSNIPYAIVSDAKITLEGIEAKSTFADACGDLVVKFNSADVKDIVEPGVCILTLTVDIEEGDDIEVDDTIIVK
ncbi:MAG: hypothetical protein JW787_07575 [Sedimentisphaerales bacterium]|nr:hypothetical protein [Sedimentisphaerales bacterium]